MRHLHRAFFLLLSLGIGVGQVGATSGILAGIAVVDITPPLGGQTIGYGSLHPTDGINNPITARVLVLESGETSVAIVTWDFCVASSPWLHAQLPELGIDRLLLLNTHTHAGPHLDQAGFPSNEIPLRATTERKVLEAIKEAKQKLFPAFFAAGEGSFNSATTDWFVSRKGLLLLISIIPSGFPMDRWIRLSVCFG